MGTKFPYRPRITRPRSWVSLHCESSSPRFRVWKKEGQIEKSMKSLSVMVVSGEEGVVAEESGVGRVRRGVVRRRVRLGRWGLRGVW